MTTPQKTPEQRRRDPEHHPPLAGGRAGREQVVLELSRVPLEQGNVIQDVLSALQGHMELARATSAEHVQEDTQSWRSELMASRARNWTSPYPVGLRCAPRC
ncbi:hypothetical protein D3875_21060 [Deinococcus cavernae]|uniref:Uncharacterized protein n=1 Tax=Deinococcus cavernae TaxID=2320857 RepID=A0A418V0T5_9DEIO|nr:hypothetical protein [Deinococcus cavernae]RJF69438.1 hypothetical protein D3875_21060 [Deinococcus cavernae]